MSVFDTTNQTQTTAVNQQQTGTGLQNLAQNTAQASQFTAGQQALQNQVTGNLSSYLQTGQLPTATYGVPQAVADWQHYLFQRDSAPQLATQFGANSPQIQNRQLEMDLGLAALANQTGQTSYLNALNSAGNWAFTPIGQTGATNQAATSANTQQTNENRNVTAQTQSTDYGGLLDSIMSLLGAGFWFGLTVSNILSSSV